jgi:hypothetical protein
MVGTLRPQPNARPVVEPEPPAFGLFGRDFQPLTSPDPFNALLVHRPSGATEHRRNPAIPVAAVLAGKFDHDLRMRGVGRGLDGVFGAFSCRATLCTARH